PHEVHAGKNVEEGGYWTEIPPPPHPRASDDIGPPAIEKMTAWACLSTPLVFAQVSKHEFDSAATGPARSAPAATETDSQGSPRHVPPEQFGVAPPHAV